MILYAFSPYFSPFACFPARVCNTLNMNFGTNRWAPGINHSINQIHLANQPNREDYIGTIKPATVLSTFHCYYCYWHRA